MKILLIGEISSPYHKLLSYKRSFSLLGHEVQVVDLSKYYFLNFLNKILNKFLFTPIYLNSKKANNIILNKSEKFKPDFIFFHKPVFVKEKTLQTLKKQNIKLFSWTGDSIFYKKNISRDYLKCLPSYDCNFFQNKLNIEIAEKKFKSKNNQYLPSANDNLLYYPVKVNKEEKNKFGSDIVFIGTFSTNEKRGSWLNKLCREGYNVKVYGNRWDRCLKCSCLKKNDKLAYKAFYGENFSKIINSSKIIINFLREHNKDSHNSRTFEIIACKGFMLHERNRKEAIDFIKDKKEAVFFGSYKEMKEKIDYYLKNNKEREKIAEAGYKRVQESDCSFICRSKKILDIYNRFNK